MINKNIISEYKEYNHRRRGNKRELLENRPIRSDPSRHEHYWTGLTLPDPGLVDALELSSLFESKAIRVNRG